MDEKRVSQLKLFSLGIVLANKSRSSDYIDVIPIEEFAFVDGNIIDEEFKHKSKYEDTSGVSHEAEVTGNNKLKAKWLAFGHSNRISAPDVVINETVLIFRFADTDEYYWTTIFREPSLRRLETVLYAYSDLPKGISEFDKDSSYWYEVSTHDQKIQLHTSKSNGEPFAFDIIINTKDGNISVNDDVGNIIKLDSVNNSAEITTNEIITLNAPIVNINANTTNISNDVNIGGNVVISGSTTVSKSLSSGSGGGSTSISGDVNVNGNIAASGTVDGSNIN